MVWVLVGVRGCVLRPTGHSLVTLISLSVSVKDRPLHKILGKSQTYYPEHILVYGRLEDLLLSCRGFWLFSDRLSGFILVEEVIAPHWVRDSRAGAWSPSLDGGPGHPGQESDGLVLLVPRVQAGYVFSGYPAEGIDSRIARKSCTACLRFSIVVRTERWKVMK